MSQQQQLASPGPALLPALVQCAELWKAGDYERIIQLLGRAHAIDPGNHRVAIDLGFAYAMQYDFASAQKYFDAALAVAPSRADALIAIGNYWARVRNYEESAACFARVIEHQTVPIAALIRLAEFYRRGRMLREAEEMVARVFHIDKRNGAALLLQARLFREQEKFGPAEGLIRSILADASCSTVHSAAWDELGTILDKNGEFDAAMAAFITGKSLMQNEASRALRQLQLLQAAREQMRRSLSPNILRQWRNAGENEAQSSRRLALLCGHARSGTTLLEYVLDAHPDIISVEETFVFSNKAHVLLGRSLKPHPSIIDQLNSLTPRTLRRTRGDYFRGIDEFMREPVGNRLLLDKNPVLTPDIPAFLRLFPESRFLVALRDPRDVCLSCFTQSAAMSPDSASWLTLEGTIRNYASIMGVWLAMRELLPNAIEVRYEDMVDNLEKNARSVLSFLNCSWDERVLRFDENARSKLVRSPTYADVTKPVYRTAVGRWRNYEKYFAPYLEKLQPFLRAFNYE